MKEEKTRKEEKEAKEEDAEKEEFKMRRNGIRERLNTVQSSVGRRVYRDRRWTETGPETGGRGRVSLVVSYLHLVTIGQLVPAGTYLYTAVPGYTWRRLVLVRGFWIR